VLNNELAIFSRLRYELSSCTWAVFAYLVAIAPFWSRPTTLGTATGMFLLTRHCNTQSRLWHPDHQSSDLNSRCVPTQIKKPTLVHRSTHLRCLVLYQNGHGKRYTHAESESLTFEKVEM
jgi:hypothetical protein